MWTEESGTTPPAWRPCQRRRQIKFRGRVPDSDKFVYGDIVQWGGPCGNDERICSWDNGVIYDVEPDSVRQLVGYDSDGREVYEGDILIDENDACRPPYNEFTVEFKAHGYKHGTSVTFETNPRRYKLKEAAQ